MRYKLITSARHGEEGNSYTVLELLLDDLTWNLLALLRRKSPRPKITWKQRTFAKALRCDLTTINEYFREFEMLGFIKKGSLHGKYGRPWEVLVPGPVALPGALADRVLRLQLELDAANAVTAVRARSSSNRDGLRPQRKALGLTQTRLALLSSVDRIKICQFELRGRKLSPEEHGRILEALQVEALRLGVPNPVTWPAEAAPSLLRSARRASGKSRPAVAIALGKIGVKITAAAIKKHEEGKRVPLPPVQNGYSIVYGKTVKELFPG